MGPVTNYGDCSPGSAASLRHRDVYQNDRRSQRAKDARPISHDEKKIELLRSGHRVIVGDKWLDEHRDHPVSRDIRTARNRRRCGIHDAYVAWTRDDAVPPDLTYDSEGFAYATI